MHQGSDREQLQHATSRLGETDAVTLLRERTPLIDDPAGRAMVRTRIEQMSIRSHQRDSAWRRTARATPLLVLVAVVLVAALFRSDGRVVAPIAVATATAAAVVAAVPADPVPPESAAVPRQWPRFQPNAVYQPYDPPGSQSPTTVRQARPRVPLPSRAQTAIIISQAPAPGALALFQEMQRRQYSG